MAKTKSNPAIGHISGKIKNLHFADYGDKQIVRGGYTRHPTTEWTEKQKQNQSDFKTAAAYGHKVLADPAKRADYREASQAKRRSVWNLAIGDAKTPPSIVNIDVSHYNGRPGEPIVIAAVDDTKVAGVSLIIQTAAGTLIEQGPAALDLQNGQWVYVAQATVSESEPAVAIDVTAVDLPGNRVQKQVDRILRRR